MLPALLIRLHVLAFQEATQQRALSLEASSVRTTGASPVSVTVCHGDLDASQGREVAFRAGVLAGLQHETPKPTKCTPIACSDHSDSSCKGSCSKMPACIPLDTDHVPTNDGDNTKFSYSRATFDDSIALIPNPEFYPAMCSSPHGPAKEFLHKKDGIVLRGGMGSNNITPNTFQREREYTLNTVSRAAAVETLKGSDFQALEGLASVSDEHASPSELASFKCMVYLEGEQVDGDLFWMLGSNSLIFMPQILASQTVLNLVPFKHYVPIPLNVSGTLMEYAQTQNGDSFANLANRYCQHMPTGVDDNDDAKKRYKQAQYILDNAKMYHEQLCDEKQEAQRMYHLLSLLVG